MRQHYWHMRLDFPSHAADVKIAYHVVRYQIFPYIHSYMDN